MNSTIKAARLAFLQNTFQHKSDLNLVALHGMLGSKSNFRSVLKHSYIS